MTAITNTTVLSTFPLIRDAIKANTDLAAKFNDNNIFEFEPQHKSASFKSFPYFLVEIPVMDSVKEVLNDVYTIKNFDVRVVLRVDYNARSKFRGYCEDFHKAIEDYASTFEASGYYEVLADLIGTDSDTVINQKAIVEAEWVVSFRGQVIR